MKRLLLIILSVVFTVTCSVCLNSTLNNTFSNSNSKCLSRHTVVIDAGHGGRDVGALGTDGAYEKYMNLAIALDLYDYLTVCGINCALTRDGDYQTYKEGDNRNRSDLYNRLDMVNEIPNSVLISIHQNHFDAEKEWGAQVWYSANTEKSKVLADNVLTCVKEYLQPDNERLNKVSDDSYYLLYKASSPSIMVECGFVSNNEENKKLQNADYQRDMAFSILLGVCNEV